jgi:predicted RND superfamily exporter protein
VDRIGRAVDQNPLLAGRVISPDKLGLAIYIPLESKDAANGVASSIEDMLERIDGPDTTKYYLAGLPLAEEAFGRDMFLQMALLAPMAGMLIFLLMLFFFRKLSLVIGAMLVAMLSVVWTMGLLTGTGFSLHIMSSMIPIFLMPIAILDSVHILSEFFDRYPQYQDRKNTLRAVYKDLTVPISYTSLTTAVAFASLSLTPIPPVQVFGLFVAFGVLAAWLLTVVFIPAFVMGLSEEGLKRSLAGKVPRQSRVITRGLSRLGNLASKRTRIIPAVFLLLTIAAVPGVLRITVNDNPVRWFRSGNEIRVASEVLNRHFPGTYNASLILEANEPGLLADPEVAASVAALQDHWRGFSAVGQSLSYADVVAGGQGPEAIPGDQDDIIRSLESAAASPGGGGVAGLITEDYRKANLQILMREGDNQVMERVVDRTEAYLDGQPLPAGIETDWAGETYLNLIWQNKMVSGMFKAFLATFVVVLLLMVALFRSLRWALLAMLPMSITILFVYGAIGFSGKDYDMPLAVLSTLVLGIGVDFAIHFIERYRELVKDTPGGQGAALKRMFEEPARALTRNALIIAIGFAPMFFAALVPYVVVGTFLASIMLLSWLTSLLLLPAVIALFQKKEEKPA